LRSQGNASHAKGGDLQEAEGKLLRQNRQGCPYKHRQMTRRPMEAYETSLLILVCLPFKAKAAQMIYAQLEVYETELVWVVAHKEENGSI
jgi:hypothetical protein